MGPSLLFLPCDLWRYLGNHSWSQALKEMFRPPRVAVEIGCLWALKWTSLCSAPPFRCYLCLKIWLMQLYLSGQMEKDRKEISFRAGLSWGDSSSKCQRYWWWAYFTHIIKHVYWNVTAAAQWSDGRLWLGDVVKQYRQIVGTLWSLSDVPLVHKRWKATEGKGG